MGIGDFESGLVWGRHTRKDSFEGWRGLIGVLLELPAFSSFAAHWEHYREGAALPQGSSSMATRPWPNITSVTSELFSSCTEQRFQGFIHQHCAQHHPKQERKMQVSVQ